MVNFSVTNCDLAEMVTELIRFLSHITLLHLINATIDSKEILFGVDYLKIMLFTALAIVIFNIFIRKILDPKFKKMKSICDS